MSRRRFALLAVVLPFVVYFLPHRYHGSGDTIPAELLPVTLLREGNLDFREFTDPNGPLPRYFRERNGRVISNYPVLPGLLNTPAHAVARILGVDDYKERRDLARLSAALVTSLSALFFFLTLRRICETERQALGFTFVYAFATTAWSTGGITLFQHGPALLFLLLALWALVDPRDGRAALSGLFLGLAVATRPQLVVVAAPLGIYVALHRRAALARFSALAAVPAVALAVYSHVYWGTVTALGQGQEFSHFGGNVLEGLAGLLVSPGRGLFIYSPVLLFGAVYLARESFRPGGDPLVRALGAGALLLLAVDSSWSIWWGGHCWAYRLLTETVPALVIATALCWQRWIRFTRRRRAAFWALLAISIALQAIGVIGYPNRFPEPVAPDTAPFWSVTGSPIAFGIEKIFGAPPEGMSIEEKARLPHHWWKPELDDDDVLGQVELPLPDGRIAGALEVRGWAAEKSGDVEVAILLDGDPAVTPERSPRPDVCNEKRSVEDCAHAGWRAVFPAPPGPVAKHRVIVELRRPSGRVRILGPVPFRWGPAGALE
jgi:hypothetical protein